MSVKAPPEMLISSTPPSKPVSRLKLFWKLSWALSPGGTAIVAEPSRLSETVAELPSAAPFGAETKKPEVVVVAQRAGVVPTGRVATHPAGNAGATTPSKFSPNDGTNPPELRVKLTLPISVGPSWRCSVAVMFPPHTPSEVKLNERTTGGPMGFTTP